MGFFLSGSSLCFFTISFLREVLSSRSGGKPQETLGAPSIVARTNRSTIAPPNFSLTKSPVSKPAPDRISLKTASLDTPRSSIDRPLHPRQYMDTLVSVVSFLVSSSHKASVKENLWFWGCYRRFGRTYRSCLYRGFLHFGGWLCSSSSVFSHASQPGGILPSRALGSIGAPHRDQIILVYVAVFVFFGAQLVCSSHLSVERVLLDRAIIRIQGARKACEDRKKSRTGEPSLARSSYPEEHCQNWPQRRSPNRILCQTCAHTVSVPRFSSREEGSPCMPQLLGRTSPRPCFQGNES